MSGGFSIQSFLKRTERQGFTPVRMLVGAVLVVAAAVAVSDAFADVYRIAERDEEQSHVFLVPFVFAWLVWARRRRLRTIAPTGTALGPVLVAIGWAMYSIGDLQLYQSMWHFGAILVVVGAFVSVAGSEFLKAFAPAFIVLAFLVPIPGFVRQAIALPLQNATATITQKVLELMWIDVDRFGSVLNINGVDVAIAEACNGLRMVFALVLVSFVFAYTTPLRESVRIVIVLASPLSAILCNVIRLAPTVWLYGNAPESTAETFHDISGWAMLPISFLLLLGIVRALRWAVIPIYRYSLAWGEAF